MKTVKLFTALLLAMICISLSSCNKDEDNDDNDSSALVGTWAWLSETNSEEYWVVFKENGTGYTWDSYNGKTSPKAYFSYSFNEKSSMLLITYDEVDTEYEDENSETVEVLTLTDKKLVLDFEDGSLTFYRQ
jgi:lipoprotein